MTTIDLPSPDASSARHNALAEFQANDLESSSAQSAAQSSHSGTSNEGQAETIPSLPSTGTENYSKNSAVDQDPQSLPNVSPAEDSNGGAANLIPDDANPAQHGGPHVKGESLRGDDSQRQGLSVPNVIIFGETGSGKSSLINMLQGSDIASISSGAVGHTFESKDFVLDVGGTAARFWDTAGLNEGEHGTVPSKEAVQNLKQLVSQLKINGVSLLVYCIRARRFTDAMRVNYDIFYKVICQGKVPILAVITGLENEAPMESWWKKNKKDFEQEDVHFEGHVCVTATRGKMRSGKGMFDEEYKESQEELRKCISDALETNKESWSVPEGWDDEVNSKRREYFERYNGRTGTEREVTRADFQASSQRSRSWSSWSENLGLGFYLPRR